MHVLAKTRNSTFQSLKDNKKKLLDSGLGDYHIITMSVKNYLIIFIISFEKSSLKELQITHFPLKGKIFLSLFYLKIKKCGNDFS